MAAYIVKLTREEASVLDQVLSRAEEAAILITPEEDVRLKAVGVDIPDGTLIAYDFGGAPDIFLDHLDSGAVEAILEHMGIEDHDLEDGSTQYEEMAELVLEEQP